MSRLELSLDAQQDLVEIAAHITRQSGSQKRGEAFLSGVFATCETLASQPAMGELRTEFATGMFRSFSVGSYVIYFQSTPAGMVVARVLHGSRDHYSIL
ncbi:MAG: type II toxin-antitoxin system RelE/ParE family toxin [Planctomycetia bacterium]